MAALRTESCCMLTCPKWLARRFVRFGLFFGSQFTSLVILVICSGLATELDDIVAMDTQTFEQSQYSSRWNTICVIEYTSSHIVNRFSCFFFCSIFNYNLNDVWDIWWMLLGVVSSFNSNEFIFHFDARVLFFIVIIIFAFHINTLFYSSIKKL